MKRKDIVLQNIQLGKLVHGGQALAETEDGKKIFVWGGLPGELVHARVIKKKKSYLEAIVAEVITPSPDRIMPLEPLSYLSTSPWQILSIDAENRAKQAILAETFDREKIAVNWTDFYADEAEIGYRNKMEFGFWGDDDGVHLAHFVRGTHGKQSVTGSVLAHQIINDAAEAVRVELEKQDIWAGDLKSLIVRCSQEGKVVAALFVKKELTELSRIKLPAILQGLIIYYSNPQSPASVITKELYALGDITLKDRINENYIIYDVNSFFQVNLPVFKKTLAVIAKETQDQKTVDLYSGVGTIGIALGSDVLVETDESNVAMARINVHGLPVEVVHAASEDALSYVTSDYTLIVDPPRAGLNQAVIDRINVVKPQKIVYLSCNPSTQARDVSLLSESYKIAYAQGFNFFPRTPHIESLVVLELKP